MWYRCTADDLSIHIEGYDPIAVAFIGIARVQSGYESPFADRHMEEFIVFDGFSFFRTDGKRDLLTFEIRVIFFHPHPVIQSHDLFTSDLT